MILILNVRREYFEDIQTGKKREEYRALKAHWLKRLSNNPEKILIRCGYPKKGDESREIEFPWKGYVIKNIVHVEFGGTPTNVIAIKLEK